MNLVSDPWIPVVMLDKTPRLVSLNEVFRDGETIADLAANPCQRIALMRLLICIAQAALDGPKDEEAWLACRSRLADAALAYLDTWQHRFNLFGEHASLQADGLDAETNALADKIDLTLACGNNPTLFDHGATPDGRVPEDARLALNLLVYQMFSPGGLIGTTQWDQMTTEKTSEHSPCLEGSMLHTLLRGKSLAETIRLNLLTQEQIRQLSNMTWGCPYWETPTLSREALSDFASTYLGRLLPLPRAIHCVETSRTVVLAAGILYPKLPEQREPTGTVIEAGTGAKRHFSYLSVTPSKHPWRELSSILALQNADRSGGATCLAHLRHVRAFSFGIWTGGLSADKAKLVDMAEWVLTLPVCLLDTLLLSRYQGGVESANRAKFVLHEAVKKYSELQKSNPVWQAKAEQFFWSTLDAQSQTLTACAIQDDAALAEKWLPIIRIALHTAYERTCPHETPRQIQAYAQGLKILDSWKEK